MVCTGTLQGGTRLGEWLSNRLMKVCGCIAYTSIDSTHVAEMLTPIDQPLDKLEDLTQDEMCVFFLNFVLEFTVLNSFWTSENMRGWIEHFSGKYIVCGKLVNP